MDTVSAYQQWQVGVAMRAGASERVDASGEVLRVDRAATSDAVETRRGATLDAWDLLRGERVDWVGVRDRFAALTTDATLSGAERHEARLGFVLAAVMTGEHRAAGMAARRVDVGAGVIALDRAPGMHVDAARAAIGSVGEGDREALLRALGKLGAPPPGGAALHAARTNAEGQQS